MKRMIGFLAAVVLTLSLGVSAYAKATPKQNSGMKTTASATKASTTRHKNKKRKRTAHHKSRKATKNRAKAKNKANVKKG